MTVLCWLMSSLPGCAYRCSHLYVKKQCDAVSTKPETRSACYLFLTVPVFPIWSSWLICPSRSAAKRPGNSCAAALTCMCRQGTGTHFRAMTPILCASAVGIFNVAACLEIIYGEDESVRKLNYRRKGLL